jgi:hypothetical protein
LSGKYWVPIGTSSYPFKGTFTGLYNDKVSSIKYATVNSNSINNSSSAVSYAGLFGVVQNATISDLIITGGDMNGNYAGGVVAYAKGNTTIKNVTNRNNVVGNIANKVQTPAASTAPATGTTVGTVQQNYQNLMNAANDRLKQAYEYQQNQLTTAKDNALREAWVKQQMVERGYPEQLSAAGINGGAAQAVLARNNADYAKQRTSIYNNYLNNLANAGQTYQQGIYGSNENFLANMAAYQQALEEMKKNYEYDEALMRLSASLNK